MFKSKSMIIIAVASVLLCGGVGTYGVVKKSQTKVAFSESGYMIDGDEALENGFAKYTFDAGDKLEFRYPDKIVFKDNTKKEVVTDADSFLHYNDGSISALNQGVLIDLNDLNSRMLNYYNLSAYATLENQGGSYALETQDSSMYFKDFMWKIGEKKYLLASDEIVITMADQQTLEFEDYVELKYYNEGILLILSEEGAYRTVSSDCIATVENGMQVDLASRTVLAKDSVLMSMEQVVIGSDDHIDVLSPIKAVKGEEKVKEEQIKIHIPTFEVIDGADGINGEQGTDGAKGKTGMEGAAGVNGMDGLVGADGLLGENGTDGTNGEQGTAGTPGIPGAPGLAGTAGLNGASGASGAAGLAGAAGIAGAQGLEGNDGLSGDEVIDGVGGGEEEEREPLQLPTFAWDSSEVSSGEAKFSVSYTEGTVALVGTEDIIVKVMDNATGREVRRLTLNSQDGTPFDIVLDGLSADTEYRIAINASYVVNNSVYEKTFLTKTFVTSALGLSFVKSYVAEDSMEFIVYKSGYSKIQSMSLVIKDAEGNAISKPVADFEDGHAFVSFDSTDGSIKSNTTYQVYLDDVYDGAKTYKMIGATEVRTLKKKPFLGVPVVVVNKADSVFDMQLEGLVDEDNGIQYFRYELYPCYDNGDVNTTNGPDKTLLISTNKVLPCEVTPEMRSVTYKVRVVASFFDNEKTVEIPTEYSAPVSMNISGFPLVTYTIKTEPDPNVAGDTAVTKHDRLVGTIHIDTNNARIRVGQQYPITVLYKSSTGDMGQFEYTLPDQTIFEDTNGNNQIDIPVNLSNLRANDNYLFTISAWTDIGDGTASSTDEYSGFSNMSIGSVIARTLEPFAFKAEIAKDDVSSIGFTVRLTSADPNQPADYEASTMDRIEFRIYKGKKNQPTDTLTLLGSTIVTADELDGGTNSAADRDSELGKAIYGESVSYTLKDTDFENLDTSQIENYYTVEIAAVQDYTDYRNTFTVENNSVAFTKSAVPPTWDESMATNGFDVIKILNNVESLGSVGQSTSLVNTNLPSDAVIGFKVTSKYDNSAGLATKFEYYALETTKNAGVTDAAGFYTDIATKVSASMIDNRTQGDTTVPSAVFMFSDVSQEGVLSRGHKYYFAGRVYIGEHTKYFPDAYAPNPGNNVMRSPDFNVPYLEPRFQFLQYSSDGTGTLKYYYWIEADDPAAISSNFTTNAGTIVNNVITHSKTGDAMGELTINNITPGKDVKVTCTVRSYANEGGTEREVVKQQFKRQSGFDNFYYTVENDNNTNRLVFVIKTDSTVKEPISRLTAIKVQVWAKTDTGNVKEFILPLDVVTDETATAYLNYSSISAFMGNQIVGKMVAIYDTNVSGMQLAEGSDTKLLAIETVAESSSASVRYVTLDPGHTNVALSSNGNAWDSLFTVKQLSSVQNKALNFDFTSPLDAKFNNTAGIEKKRLGFGAQMRGTVLYGPDAVSVFKQVAEKVLNCKKDGTTTENFEVSIADALPTVDLWLGNSYNIITKPESATVNWMIEGHESLISSGKIKDNKMYIELYEVVGGTRKTILSNGQTTDGTTGASFTPVVLTGAQDSYVFEINGLTTNKTYAIHFYYYGPDGTTINYPLDYKYPDTSLFYTFATLDSVVLTQLPIKYKALSYDSKYIEIGFVPSTTTGYQVKYEFVKLTGPDTYQTVLSSEQLAQMGIISNTTLITEPTTTVEFKMAPGQVKWVDSVTGNTEYFKFNSDDYFLKMTPVSLVNDTQELGSPEYVKLSVDEPKEPFYNVKTTPGSDSVKFRIAVTDNQKVIIDGNYKVVLSGRDKDGNPITLNNVTGLKDAMTEVYQSSSPATITVSGLDEGDTVTLEIYSVYDMDNKDTGESIDISNINHKVKVVSAKPLGDLTYDLGNMSILSAGSNRAYLYFSNSVGLQDANCPITSIIYAVSKTEANGTTTSTTFSDAFVVKDDTTTEDIKYVELNATFETGVWYSVYVKFLGADGKSLEEATFSYRG